MKYITINKVRISVSDEVYIKIKSQKRYEERLIKKNAEREVLISDEEDFDKIKFAADENPYEIIERQEVLSAVMEIIRTKLTPKERYVLTSVYLDNKKQYEVAEELDLTIDQVRYIVEKALKKIRRNYDIMD